MRPTTNSGKSATLPPLRTRRRFSTLLSTRPKRNFTPAFLEIGEQVAGGGIDDGVEDTLDQAGDTFREVDRSAIAGRVPEPDLDCFRMLIDFVALLIRMSKSRSDSQIGDRDRDVFSPIRSAAS